MSQTLATALLALAVLVIFLGAALGYFILAMSGNMSRAEEDPNEFPAAPVPEREQQEDANG